MTWEILESTCAACQKCALGATRTKSVFGTGNREAELLFVGESERPMAVQLFGSEPEFMARAAEIALKYSPDIIDINMGCPAPKIVNNNSGSALMNNPALAGEIIKAVASAVDPGRVVLVDTAPAALAQDPADSIDLITITTIITIFPFLVSADPTMATDMEAVALED